MMIYRIVTYTPDRDNFAVQSLHETQQEADTQCAANRASGPWYLRPSEVEAFEPLRPLLCQARDLRRGLGIYLSSAGIETEAIARIVSKRTLGSDEQAVLAAWEKAREVCYALSELVYRQEGKY